MNTKKTKYKVINGFLNEISFLSLQNLIIDGEFPWFKRERQVYTKDKKELGYLTHSFYNEHNINSVYYNNFIIPILNQLGASSVIQVRANLTPSVFYIEKGSAFHCDYIFESPSKTAILYLKSTNGGTEIKIDNEIKYIKDEENKMLIFDSDVKHRGIVSTDSDFRYVLNFNYFENQQKKNNENS
tara:strand:+ start:851 stop:1405 length:555 start_codon:yes stop_codon:yes gene_type:complete